MSKTTDNYKEVMKILDADIKAYWKRERKASRLFWDMVDSMDPNKKVIIRGTANRLGDLRNG